MIGYFDVIQLAFIGYIYFLLFKQTNGTTTRIVNGFWMLVVAAWLCLP